MCPEQNAPLELGVLAGVPRLLCLGRGGSPALLTAQLCIYSLFARKNLFIFRVATCQRLPAQDNPITPLMGSPERANNRRDCRGGGHPAIPGVELGGRAGGQGKRPPQAPGSCLGAAFAAFVYFFRGTRSLSIKSCKINSGFMQFFWFPKQWQSESGCSQLFVMGYRDEDLLSTQCPVPCWVLMPLGLEGRAGSAPKPPQHHCMSSYLQA